VWLDHAVLAQNLGLHLPTFGHFVKSKWRRVRPRSGVSGQAELTAPEISPETEVNRLDKD
jgi:hypothetical protein